MAVDRLSPVPIDQLGSAPCAASRSKVRNLFVLSIIRLCGYDWFLKLAQGRTVKRLEGHETLDRKCRRNLAGGLS
jgi:hypothetical protein